MKKLMIATLMTLSVAPAFAQHYPYPRPNPNPFPYPRQCQAAAVDRFNRIMATFWGRPDPRGFCHEAIRNCNLEVRRRGWIGARCVLLNGNRW